MTKSRKRYSPDQKAEVVRKYLSEKQSVSDLAEEYDVKPSMIHSWARQVMEQAARAFEKPSKSNPSAPSQSIKVTRLEQKLTDKNEVISELMEENLKAKKQRGGF